MNMVPIELLVKDVLADELYDDGFAEIAFRRSDAKFREMVKCKIAGNSVINEEILNKIAVSALNTDVLSTDIYDIRKSINKTNINLGNISKSIKTIPGSLKGLSTKVDGIYQGVNIVKGLSYINVGLSMVNIAADVVGFVVIRNNLLKLNDTVMDIAREVGEISIIQKNSKISECNKLIMQFNSLSSKIQDGDPIDLDSIDNWLINTKTFISEMISNLTGDALEIEVFLNMISSLLPSYTIMLGYYLKSYYFKKKKRPANYDIYINLFCELMEISFDEMLFDYYCLNKNYSLLDTKDVINSQFLINLNDRIFIEDQQYLLETLKTKNKFDEFESKIDVIVENRINEMIPQLSDEGDISQDECKQLFGIK